MHFDNGIQCHIIKGDPVLDLYICAIDMQTITLNSQQNYVVANIIFSMVIDNMNSENKIMREETTVVLFLNFLYSETSEQRTTTGLKKFVRY